MVCAAAAHRKAAFAACEYAIDAVKARAPIWKREIMPTERGLEGQRVTCLTSNCCAFRLPKTA